MKYKTFRSLIIASGLVAVVGGGYLMCSPSHQSKLVPVEPVAIPAEVQPAEVQPASVQPAATTKDYRAYLLSELGKPSRGDKIKDAIAGPVKVNMYAKNGVWDRAKVDLDRDEKWDEKWWMNKGKVMREVSPDDNEKYGAGTVEGTVNSNGTR